MNELEQMTKTIFEKYLIKHRVRKFVKYNYFFNELEEWDLESGKSSEVTRLQVSEREAINIVKRKFKDYL